MSDDSLERFETKLAFLEQAGAELGEELYRQRKEIDELRARLIALAGRIEAGTTPAEDTDPLRERPPHY
jgi:uncharacterized coiled-coil protein SlyX